jgi:hypothetical protein
MCFSCLNYWQNSDFTLKFTRLIFTIKTTAMADEIDLADDIISTMLTAQIEKARKQQETAQATGFCLHCDEPITELGRRWCDSDCRDDWEADNKD